MRQKNRVVAAVSGPALGLGMTLLLHCDLVYASDTAVFRLPFVPYGLCPEGGSSYLLPKLVGHYAACELLFFGDEFDAGKAREIGLVSQIWPVDELMQQVMLKVEKLAELPPQALNENKSSPEKSLCENRCGNDCG